MERCPVCRARFKKEKVCYRCGADCSLLLQIETQSHEWVSSAVKQCMHGEMAAAQENMQLALESNASPFILALSQFMHKKQLKNRRVCQISRLGKYASSDFIRKRLLAMISGWLVNIKKLTNNINK